MSSINKNHFWNNHLYNGGYRLKSIKNSTPLSILSIVYKLITLMIIWILMIINRQILCQQQQQQQYSHLYPSYPHHSNFYLSPPQTSPTPSLTNSNQFQPTTRIYTIRTGRAIDHHNHHHFHQNNNDNIASQSSQMLSSSSSLLKPQQSSQSTFYRSIPLSSSSSQSSSSSVNNNNHIKNQYPHYNHNHHNHHYHYQQQQQQQNSLPQQQQQQHESRQISSRSYHNNHQSSPLLSSSPTTLHSIASGINNNDSSSITGSSGIMMMIGNNRINSAGSGITAMTTSTTPTPLTTPTNTPTTTPTISTTTTTTVIHHPSTCSNDRSQTACTFNLLCYLANGLPIEGCEDNPSITCCYLRLKNPSSLMLQKFSEIGPSYSLFYQQQQQRLPTTTASETSDHQSILPIENATAMTTTTTTTTTTTPIPPLQSSIINDNNGYHFNHPFNHHQHPNSPSSSSSSPMTPIHLISMTNNNNNNLKSTTTANANNNIRNYQSPSKSLSLDHYHNVGTLPLSLHQHYLQHHHHHQHNHQSLLGFNSGSSSNNNNKFEQSFNLKNDLLSSYEPQSSITTFRNQNEFDYAVSNAIRRTRPDNVMKSVFQEIVNRKFYARNYNIDDICGKPMSKPRSRIIGGQDAYFGEFPWQVHIKITKHQCGGALVNSRFIVTAAHCIYQAPIHQLNVIIGAHDIEDHRYQDIPPQYFHVQRVILHPNFRFSASHPDRYDVALIKLDSPVRFSDSVLPVCLPIEENRNFEGHKGVVTGWGKTDPALSNRYGTRLLQKVDVPIIDNEKCETWHRTRGIDLRIFSEMMCAGYEDGQKDACVGDSGGPLVINMNGRWTLAGITSAGFGCAQSRQPGIYHRVSHTVNWIRQTLHDEEEKDNNLNQI